MELMRRFWQALLRGLQARAHRYPPARRKH
jgi:hypothetical protein